MSERLPATGSEEETAETAAPGHLSRRLRALLERAPAEPLQVRALFDALAGRGHAALLVVIALPFSLPIPLFGLSTIFGLVLAFIGLRIAFRRRPWLPDWMLRKPLRNETLVAMEKRTARLERLMRRFLRSRSTYLCNHPVLHRLHGLTVMVLAILLALPLPIPATNLITAFPIVMFGLALLEDDGMFLIAAYCVAIVSIAVFVVLFWMGGLGVERLIESA